MIRKELVLGEKGVEVGAHVGGVPLLEADDFAGDFAVAVDYVGFGEKRGAVGEGDGGGPFLGGRVTIGGEGYALVNEEFGEGEGVFVSGDAEDEGIAGLNIFLQAIEGGGFLYAGRAPTGPKVEDNYFAAEVFEVHGFAGYLERKVAGGSSCNGGFALAVAGHGEDDDDGDGERQDAPDQESSACSHGCYTNVTAPNRERSLPKTHADYFRGHRS
jgi:hypothetical protein